MAEEIVVRKKKKRRKKRYLLKFAIFVALCVGAYFFLTSSFFAVQTYEVEGNDFYTAEQVIDRAGLKQGVNIFTDISAGDIKQALLADPYIRSASVKRHLPDKVTLTIEEREEAAYLPYGDTYAVLDADGLVLRKADAAPALPELVGLTIVSVNTGEALEVEETKALSDTLKLIERIKDNEITFKKIDISNVIIKAYIYDQLICRGTPENILENLENGNLAKVLYDLYSDGIERGVINLGQNGYCAFSPEVDASDVINVDVTGGEYAQEEGAAEDAAAAPTAAED